MKHSRLEFLGSDYQSSVKQYEENWKTLDEVLYQLCKGHSNHQDLASVAAKVTIIGRAYASGIERKVPTAGSPASSISQVVDLFLSHGREIDDWISRLGLFLEPLAFEDVSEILTVHGRMVKLLTDITKDGQSARSFASKYLHFHKSIVPIYDNISAGFIPKLVRLQDISIPTADYADADYAEYVCRFAKLYELANKSGTVVTVRLLDWYLMWKKETYEKNLPLV